MNIAAGALQFTDRNYLPPPAREDPGPPRRTLRLLSRFSRFSANYAELCGTVSLRIKGAALRGKQFENIRRRDAALCDGRIFP